MSGDKQKDNILFLTLSLLNLSQWQVFKGTQVCYSLL